jgi:hypothetical protein
MSAPTTRPTSRPASWIDRLRIERVLWTLDVQLQSLPTRSRRAIRREMRTNLRASAAELGTREAIQRLGNVHRLALEYLDAEYADRPRPRWLMAGFWAVTVEILILWSAILSQWAFVDGIEAGNPHPDGRFSWNGLAVLGVSGDANYTDGQLNSFGLSLDLWALVYLLAALLIGGRLWRLIPLRRQVRRDRRRSEIGRQA